MIVSDGAAAEPEGNPRLVSTWHRWGRWVALVAIVAVVGVAVGLGATDDLSTHRSLQSARSSLASTQQAVAGLQKSVSGLTSTLHSLQVANAALSSANAALSSENAALVAQATARAVAPIFTKSGSGGISPDASLGFVVTKSGPYVVQYTFSGCSNDSPLMFVVQDAETSEDLDVAPNASGALKGGTAVYLDAGNWFLFGGGQLVSNGDYDPRCNWTISVAPNN